MVHNETIVDARGELETAIVMALMMDKAHVARIPKPKQKAKGWVLEEMGMDKFCPPEAAFPRQAYTLDAQSGFRLYTERMSDLVVSPIDAIGGRLEVMILCPGATLKWSCIKPMARPRGITAMTNQPCKWFAWHYREFRRDLSQTYYKEPMALTDDGEVCMLKPLGQWMGWDAAKVQQETREQLAMTLSVFEDAHRTTAFLATVEEHVKLMFPVGADAYKSFLAMRDGYRFTPTGRRNPILHWCAEHLRKRNGESFPVAEHLRGAEEFVVGPMRLSLEPTQGYGAFMGATF
jgi:hypothetical protein